MHLLDPGCELEAVLAVRELVPFLAGDRCDIAVCSLHAGLQANHQLES